MKKIIVFILLIAVAAYAQVQHQSFKSTVSVQGGNIRLQGNTVSSADTNGNILLDPNGTGQVSFFDLTASTVPYLDASKYVKSSAVTPTELGFLSGILSDAVGISDAQILTNKDIDGGTASNTSRITVPKNTKTNLDGLTRKQGTVVYASDEEKLYVDDGTSLTEIGSGGGGAGAYHNFAQLNSTNWDAETGDETDWSAFWNNGGNPGTLNAVDSGTTAIKFGTYAMSIDFAESGDIVLFDGGDPLTIGENTNCIASFYYKGFDTNVSVDVYDADNTLVKATATLATSADWDRNEDLSFVCVSGVEYHLRFHGLGDAAVGYVDDVWVGENYNVGSVTPQDSFSAKVSSTGAVTDENQDWISGNCVMSGTNSATGTCSVSDLGLSGKLNCGCTTVSAATNHSVICYVDNAASTASQVVYYATANGTQSARDINLSCQKSSADAPVTAVKADQTIRSRVRLHTHNGYGSTNTKIPRFTTTVYNTGSAITYADSAANGASFTINRAGIYSISFTMGGLGASGVAYAGASVNSSQLTTNISTITAADRLGFHGYSGAAQGGSASSATFSWTGYLEVGDVVRPHTVGSAPDAAAQSAFSIAQGSDSRDATLVKGGVVTSSDGVTGSEYGEINCDAASSLVQNPGSWMTAVTNRSTTACTITIAAGVFSAEPYFCNIETHSASPQSTACDCTSATSCTVYGANADYDAYVHIAGPR